MKMLTFEQLLPPVTDLGIDFAASLQSWSWLFDPASCKPVLITTLGDLFVSIDDEIFFLDSENGTFARVASSVGEWKRAVEDAENQLEWFCPPLVQPLLEHGLTLRQEQVFSPLLPPVLGGRHVPENYVGSQWRNHLHVMGQVHHQIKNLPPGTKLDQITFDRIE